MELKKYPRTFETEAQMGSLKQGLLFSWLHRMERKPQYNAGLTYSEEIVNKAQEVPEMLLQHSFLFIKYRALALIGAGCIFFFQTIG